MPENVRVKLSSEAAEASWLSLRWWSATCRSVNYWSMYLSATGPPRVPSPRHPEARFAGERRDTLPVAGLGMRMRRSSMAAIAALPQPEPDRPFAADRCQQAILDRLDHARSSSAGKQPNSGASSSSAATGSA